MRHVKVNEKTYANNVVQDAKDKSNEEQLLTGSLGQAQVESKELSLVHVDHRCVLVESGTQQILV